MAGDWIKMSTALRTHPKVVRLALATKTDKFRVIGGLHAVWSLFDAHSVDGSLVGYTFAAIDEEIGWKGFSKAVAGVQWLAEDEDGVRIPEFDTHNGKSAKRRASNTNNKRTSRGQEDDASSTNGGHVSSSREDKTATREEKRREEETALPQAAAAADPPERKAEPDPPLPPPLSKSVQERALDCVILLKARGCRIAAANPYALEWAKNGVTDAQLLTAFDRAEEQRQRKSDATPINAGLVNSIVGDIVAKTPPIDFEALARI